MVNNITRGKVQHCNYIKRSIKQVFVLSDLADNEPRGHHGQGMCFRDLKLPSATQIGKMFLLSLSPSTSFLGASKTFHNLAPTRLSHVFITYFLLLFNFFHHCFLIYWDTLSAPPRAHREHLCLQAFASTSHSNFPSLTQCVKLSMTRQCLLNKCCLSILGDKDDRKKLLNQ